MPIIMESWGGEEAFNKYIEEKMANSSLDPTFECQICYTDVSISQCVTLECDHRFCQD
jgi:hypothetical protein